MSLSIPLGYAVLIAIAIVLVVVAISDMMQRRHAILRNFPIVGHLRYWLERIGPEMRQYIVTNNEEERPFSRDQRRWIYASAKEANNYYSFGTEHDLERTSNSIVIRHVAFPLPSPGPGQIGSAPDYELPCAKIVGANHGRRHAYRPRSIVNISGMSYGSLSAPAVEAMAKGAQLAGCLHNTGEGGLTSFHEHGADLIFQIGTGYFGVRDEEGRFSLPRLADLAAQQPIRAIEIKLSQGAKPGHGGVLPAAKVTPDIARFRGVREGRDCISPPGHAAFTTVDTMIEFIERIADETGLPVGIKVAVGHEAFWEELPRRMRELGGGPDFITIDGGEGGTGAAPLVFQDNVSLPFKIGMARAYSAFAQHDMHERVVFAGSGKLGFPEEALFALALGCDYINVAREAMIAVGCIQAQICHTNRCPTGVTTQNKWLMRGLDPQSKSARLANYIVTLRKELLEISRACGRVHPALVDPADIEIVNQQFRSQPVHELFGYELGWGHPGTEDVALLLEHLGSPSVAASEAGNIWDDRRNMREQMNPRTQAQPHRDHR